MSKKRTILTLLPRLVGNIALSVLQYLLVVVTLAACAVLFHLLNRTHVRGKRRLRLHPGIFIVSNHQSLLDSFLVGYTVCAPTLFYRPALLPWHLPDRRNFFSNPLMRPLMRLWRAIPVDRENGDRGSAAMQNLASNRQITAVLKRGIVHVFIEGTRSRDQAFQPPKMRVAKRILQTGASVLPVHLNGMHGVQPYLKSADDAPPSPLHILGKHFAWIFRIRSGNVVTVDIGEELSQATIATLAGEGDLNTRAQRLANALMEKLRELRDRNGSAISAA